MAHLIYDDVYQYNGKLWKVNAKRSGLRTDILRVLLGLTDAMLKRHRKVFIFRFDLSVNDYSDTNELMTSLARRLGKRMRSHYKIDMAYCWVREHEKAKQQHYHFCLLLNGSIVQTEFMIKQWLSEIWEYYGRCSWAGYHNLTRDDYQGIQDATHHISYLAKPRGKGYRPEQTKDYGHSRF